MKWAVAIDYRPDNPAGDAFGQALGRQQTVVQHMRALPHGAVADALATVRAFQASVTTKRAFEFLVLTAARSGEVRFATWDEIDTAGRVWTLSAARMKMKRDHRVPLCRRALEILDAARMLGDAGSWVFNTRGDMPPDAKQFRRLLERCGIACVPHGFRSSLRSVRPRRDDHPTEGSFSRCQKVPFLLAISTPRPSCRRVLMAERRTVTASGRARRLAGRGRWRSLHQNSVRRAISALTLASPRSATPCNERAAASDS